MWPDDGRYMKSQKIPIRIEIHLLGTVHIPLNFMLVVFATSFIGASGGSTDCMTVWLTTSIIVLKCIFTVGYCSPFNTSSDMQLPLQLQHQTDNQRGEVQTRSKDCWWSRDEHEHILLAGWSSLHGSYPTPYMHADKLLPYDLCSTKHSLQITDQGVALCFLFQNASDCKLNMCLVLYGTKVCATSDWTLMVVFRWVLQQL